MEKHLGMLQQINQVKNKVNYKAIDAAYAEFIGLMHIIGFPLQP